MARTGRPCVDDMTPVELATARRVLFERVLGQVARRNSSVLSGIPSPQERADALRLLTPLATATDVAIGSVLVNGDRVDLQLRSGRDEWALVLDVDQNAPSEIRGVSVFKRPPAFSGRPGGFVIVLRGPSCSGKTSLMAAFCDMADTPWLRFDDHMFGSLPLRFLIWPDASGALRSGFRAALPAIARAGNQIITVAPSPSQQELQSDLDDIPHLFVRLDCALPVLIRRLQSRSDRWEGLVQETTVSDDDWRYDLRIDTALNSSNSASSILLMAVHRSVETGVQI
jgi:chloramphenicol 3-O-phosphotransferase